MSDQLTINWPRLLVYQVIPNPYMFLTACGLLLPFGAPLDLPGASAALILLPPLLSLLSMGLLVIFTKKAKTSAVSS